MTEYLFAALVLLSLSAHAKEASESPKRAPTAAFTKWSESQFKAAALGMVKAYVFGGPAKAAWTTLKSAGTDTVNVSFITTDHTQCTYDVTFSQGAVGTAEGVVTIKGGDCNDLGNGN